jgi:Ca-activated chloride channel family protein
MFQFEDISYIYYLGVIPFLVLIYLLIVWNRNSQINKLGDKKLIQKLIPGWSAWRKHFKFGLLLFAVTLFLLAGANPQWGTKKEKVKATSADIYIALDISQSMMAEDVGPNRLERAKRFAQQLVTSLKGERIGLIFFAGSAYLQIPLTLDYASAELFLRAANTNQAGSQGTALIEAIDLADQGFIEDEPRQRALVLITDGEDHDEGALERAEIAFQNGMRIFTIGVGTTAGSFVPYMERGREQFKKDESGNLVKSKLNLDLIKKVAVAGGGSSYLIQEGSSIIEDLVSRLEQLEKREVEQRSFSEYQSYFQYFLAFGIFLLLFEFLFSEIASGKSRKSIFEI